MKRIILLGFLLLPFNLAVADANTRNVFLVTIDGLRWQEVFRGLDESLAANTEYNKREKWGRIYFPDSSPLSGIINFGVMKCE